ncbi:hypothetical protein [Amorphus coralli]|uniref:hypothetical protein n=1 Tax=Amorphus coralli TaxID=340680 RepID=UPI0003780579|nr:hypothetical protein [Amorphus coralli]
MIRTAVAIGLVTCFATGAAMAQSGPEVQEMRAACREDAKRLCSNVPPIEVQLCLQENIDQVSERCKATVASVQRQDENHD